MTETAVYRWLLAGWLALAPAVFVLLLRVTAPYGRHGRRGWGPAVPAAAGWVLMELPAPLLFAFFWWAGGAPLRMPQLLFLALWELHYLHRALVYPLLRIGRGRPMPLSIPLLAIVFNVVNAYLNGRYLFGIGPAYPAGWLRDPRCLAGAALFFAGWAVNLHSDAILRRLRRPGETGYRIPRGGLFRFVSCPNYLGEIVEWIGWALMTWSPPGLAFALWTIANLAPRALAHHRWYRSTFPDYPRERRALVPFVL